MKDIFKLLLSLFLWVGLIYGFIVLMDTAVKKEVRKEIEEYLQEKR